jgi:hypothetical protein
MKGQIRLMIEHVDALREEMIAEARFDDAHLLRDVKWALEKEQAKDEAIRAVLRVDNLQKLDELKRALLLPALMLGKYE